MAPNESYPQHVVTAVIVGHDGAAWLPHVADAVLEQTRPVQRVVAVDTGSRDRSGSVLAAKFGQAAVFGMDRSTGYGAAVARALAHRAANVPVPGAPGGPAGDRVEWLWLLHDDCEPAPDALEQLLRGAAETSAAAVLGPKLRDWGNREVILEAGVTLDTAARRVTGIEPREVDQGQHDGDRDTLAVSSAGMLVRRDVWEQVGGFDTGMGLFMEDIDFCWRVHAAGYRVRVITDAVAFHVQAATKHRRLISVGRRARMLDRRNGLLTLLGNLPFRQMLSAVAGNLLVSLLRITFFLLAKRLAAAMDEAAALVAVLSHPLRLISMRRRRARGRRAAYSRVRADLPAGHSLRRLAEFAAATLSRSQSETTGAHHASADPTEDDSMLVDNGLARRLLTSPSLLTFVALLVVALVAGGSLIGSGPLGGGSLVPAWGGAGDLWRTYVQAFHPTGIGSTTPAPPWLALIAGLATVLAGKPWLAIDVILLGCVPLAGMTAMLAVRRVTTSTLVRVWGSATYALLPVATGVVAAGRFGSAVAFVLLPLIALLAGRIFTSSRKQASRAAWATGLLVAIAAAFVPLIWLLTAVACVLAACVFRNTRKGLLRNLLVIVLTAPVLLVPWTFTLASHPSDLLLEAGLPQPGTPVTGLPARTLMLLSPGGPGLPPYWVTAGLVAVALAALFSGRRRKLITAGWGLALSGLLTAIVVSHLTVMPDDGGPVVVWAGLPLALAALGLLLAGVAGAGALSRLTAGRTGWQAILSGRGMWAALLAILGCSVPLFAAASWLGSGVSGPVHPVSGQLVPELVAVADGKGNQVRTLVLRESGGHVSYLLLRGPSPAMADTSLTPPPAAQQALSRVVAALTSPAGGLAVNQVRMLAGFDIGFILVQAPVDHQLDSVLDNVNGLHPYSTTSAYSLWQLSTPPARVSLLESDGTVVPVPSGSIGVSAAQLPQAGGTLMLAEPAGGWSASVNGHALTQVPSPAGSWAQAYRLPAGGGTLSLSHSGLGHDLLLLFELLAFLVAAGLALPGVHIAEEGQRAAPAPESERTAGTGARSASGTDDEDEDEEGPGRLAGAGSGRRAALAAVGARAGSSRSPSRGRSRSRSAKAGGGRAATRGGRSGRAGAGRAGADGARTDGAGTDGAGVGRAGADRAADDRGAGRRSGTGLSRTGKFAAGLDDASRENAGLPARAGGPAGAGGRSGSIPGERDSRLADAWPHAAQDSGRDESRWDDLVRDDAGRRDTPAAESWPYPPGDELTGEPRRGGAVSGQARARPHPGGEDLGAGSAVVSNRAELAGWPEPAGLPEPAGRSPSVRSPSGAWPYTDNGGGPGRGDDHASSPSGSWPYPGEADRGWEGAGSDRSSRAQHDDEHGRTPGPARAGRARDDEPRDDELQGPRRMRWPAARSGRAGQGDPPDRVRHDSDRYAADRSAADRRDGRYDGDRYDSDRYDQGRDDSDRYDQGRYDGDRHDEDRYASDRPRSDRLSPDRLDSDRLDSGRYDSDGRDSASSDRAASSGHRAIPDRGGRSDRAGRDDRAAAPDRWGRRGRDDRPSVPAGSRRSADPSPAPWSGGDDALEPLPPIDGPLRAPAGHSAWRPAGEESADWDGPDDSRAASRRWSAPEPEYESEYEPGYEGDTW